MSADVPVVGEQVYNRRFDAVARYMGPHPSGDIIVELDYANLLRWDVADCTFGADRKSPALIAAEDFGGEWPCPNMRSHECSGECSGCARNLVYALVEAAVES